MRTSVRLPLAVVVGGGLFLGAHAMFSPLQETSQQQNQLTLSCADQLGASALAKTTLPPECSALSDDFGYETITYDKYNPATQNTTETSETTYYLPTRKEFLENYLLSTSEANAMNQRIDNLSYSMAGLIGVIAFFGTLGIVKGKPREKAKSQETSS